MQGHIRLCHEASLSSQSKSNSCIPIWACLCGWRGSSPCLVTTGGVKGKNDHTSFCSCGRGTVLTGVLKGSLVPNMSPSDWEIWSLEMPSQLDFSFAVLATRAEGHGNKSPCDLQILSFHMRAEACWKGNAGMLLPMWYLPWAYTATSFSRVVTYQWKFVGFMTKLQDLPAKKKK